MQALGWFQRYALILSVGPASPYPELHWRTEPPAYILSSPFLRADPLRQGAMLGINILANQRESHGLHMLDSAAGRPQLTSS